MFIFFKIELNRALTFLLFLTNISHFYGKLAFFQQYSTIFHPNITLFHLFSPIFLLFSPFLNDISLGLGYIPTHNISHIGVISLRSLRSLRSIIVDPI